jgi:hypothetical protein
LSPRRWAAAACGSRQATRPGQKNCRTPSSRPVGSGQGSRRGGPHPGAGDRLCPRAPASAVFPGGRGRSRIGNQAAKQHPTSTPKRRWECSGGSRQTRKPRSAARDAPMRGHLHVPAMSPRRPSRAPKCPFNVLGNSFKSPPGPLKERAGAKAPLKRPSMGRFLGAGAECPILGAKTNGCFWARRTNAF